MPPRTLVNARQPRETANHPSALDDPRIERTAQLAVTLATQVLPLARTLLRRRRKNSGIKADVIEPEHDETPSSPLERTTGRLARAVNSVGATLYDYSNGQYGIKPVDPKELRRLRKSAERQAHARSRAARALRSRKRRGGIAWLLVGLGALLAGGTIALIILQREQVRAAATQALDRGRASWRQAHRQLAATRQPTPPADDAATPALESPAASPSS